MNASQRKLMPLSEAQIVGLYSQLYPSLLMYGAPILPTVHILKVASAEVWTDILYDFSSLLLGMYALTVKQISSENLRIFDNNEVFAAAQMLSFCIGNAGPDELPLLLNDVFGEGSVMTQGGGKRKNFSFRNYFTNTSTSQKGGDRYNNMSNSQVETEFSTRGYGDGAGSESFTAEQKRQFMRNMNRSRAAPSSASASGSVLAPSRARPSNTLGNAQRNLGITAEVAAQLQRELQAPAAAAAVTNIVTRLSAGESLNLATLSPFNTSQQLAILHQIYQTVGTQRAMQMVARAAHCDALVAGGGAFSPAKVGEFVNKLRTELQKDNRIVQTLLEKFNEGKQLEKSDREGLSADASAILEQMTSLLQREETKMGLTKAIKEFKQKAVKHKKEFYDSLQMLGISAAATVVSWVAIDWASSGTEDQSNPLAGDPTTATINATTLASATLALNATATAAVAAADSVGWGAWLGGAAEGAISGAAYYATMAVGRTAVKLGEGASSATQNLTGETPESLLYGAASAMNPMRPIYSLLDTLKQTWVVAAKPLAVLTVGLTTALTVSRIRAFRRAEQNIQFADENLMRLILTIQGQYLGQLWSGYLKQKLEMLSHIATVFGQNLSQAQITGLEAAGGLEALATGWETKFSAELQQSGMQQIINTLSPQEALALQEVINTELQTARGEVQRALTEYKQFLRQPLADQVWAGSHNVLVTCSATALGGIKTVTSGIMSAAQAGAAAAIAGGAGVAAVGASMLQQRANAENQALREQIQRLAAQRTAEEQEARRVANEAKRVANEATAAQARRVANNARRVEEEARRVANNARRASEARRVEEEARRVANNAALVPRNGDPMFVAGLAPALAAIPRLHMEQRELAILMRLYDEQQRERVALGNAPAAPRVPRIEEIDGGGRHHVKRRSMTKKHRKHTKKTRKH